MNLTLFNNNGLELLIDQVTGQCFASISAVARMCDRQYSTIYKFVNGYYKGYSCMELKLAEIATNGGLQGVFLLDE